MPIPAIHIDVANVGKVGEDIPMAAVWSRPHPKCMNAHCNGSITPTSHFPNLSQVLCAMPLIPGIEDVRTVYS